VRALGAAECAIAGAGAVLGGVFAAIVGVAYCALACVAYGLARRAPALPCGCLGASDAPAGIGHVVLNLVCAAVSFAAAAGDRPLTVLREQPLAGVPFLALTACCAWLAALTVEALPSLRAAIREGKS
jgi:hypothetical protein